MLHPWLEHPLVASILATLLISLAPFVLLFLIYLCRRNKSDSQRHSSVPA